MIVAEAGIVSAAETVLEGAAAGAFAIARSTDINSTNCPLLICHEAPIASLLSREKAYVYGGDVQQQKSDNTVHAITLPSDLALKDTDYQCISATVAPNPPLASYSNHPSASSETRKNVIPTPRAAHTATSIDSTICGRPPSSATSVPLSENGTIHAFDTINHSWSTPTPRRTHCSSDFPCPRTYASSSSTPHPLWEKEPLQLVPRFISRKCPEPSVSPRDHARYDTDMRGRGRVGWQCSDQSNPSQQGLA